MGHVRGMFIWAGTQLSGQNLKTALVPSLTGVSYTRGDFVSHWKYLGLVQAGHPALGELQED